MATFIKKERLGSGPPPRKGIMRAVESMQTFQALQQHYAQQKAQAASELKEKYEANSEVQRWRTQMTPEERTRDAIERMVPTTKEVLKMRNGGHEVSYEEGRAKAVEIAEKSDKQKKED
jgi:hypothetical protein